MRQTRLEQHVVEYIPEQLHEGVLYVSHRYGTAAHKCCCGCGEEVITPLSPTDWSIHTVGKNVTLNPSVGNWSFACQSHYFIRSGRVVWAGQMSKQEIGLGRARDRALKKAYFEKVIVRTAPASELSPENATRRDKKVGWFQRLVRSIARSG